jgi:hypothetical protein
VSCRSRRSPRTSDDPLGREPGEAMVSARGQRDWAAIRRTSASTCGPRCTSSGPRRPRAACSSGTSSSIWTRTTVEPNTAAVDPVRRPDGAARLAVAVPDRRPRGVHPDERRLHRRRRLGYPPDGDLVLLDGLRERLDPSMHWSKIRALRCKVGRGHRVRRSGHASDHAGVRGGRAACRSRSSSRTRTSSPVRLPAAARVDAGVCGCRQRRWRLGPGLDRRARGVRWRRRARRRPMCSATPPASPRRTTSCRKDDFVRTRDASAR